ncbi:hypothetical protein ACLI1A_15590 [Flavobacterium sp. RHBU_3]|uniref:hypothetical protein n=1 Tax=Flavobacterium sp. RHBU_3 TaxID=3391184 RepID=UPI003984FC3A
MKNVSVITAALAILALAGCKNDNPKPKVIYRDKPAAVQPKKIDSSQIKVADLPVLMEGTKYLIHPVGDLRIYETDRDAGDSRVAVSYAISNYSRYEITGYFANLKFQHADSTALRPLTDKKVQIQTVTYLNTVAERTRKQILVYSLMDGDTNQDGKVDSNDIKAFYISNINGTGFKKLSGETQELVDWNVIEAQNRVYFRTLEDINKNGAFDKDDAMHYHYVDLLSAGWEVKDYEPVQ